MPRTGFLWDELYMWHNTGTATGFLQSGIAPGIYNEPDQHWESAASKRRFKNLLDVSGLTDKLHLLRPRKATEAEAEYYHTKPYLEKVKEMSEIGFGDAGELTPVGKGSWEIALLSAGGCITGVDAVLDGKVDNAYILNRPPGHHAEADRGRGFCILNNVVIAAEHARKARGLKRVAIIDWDVHHGNGTQKAFYSDPGVLFISLHQDKFYPPDMGFTSENGSGSGEGYNINVPLPPGSGHGAYVAAIRDVVVPAFEAYQPELILVSSGFDAGAFDPLGRQMCTSETYREMTRLLMEVADKVCGGKIVCVHEGGYSPIYVPYCGLATVEQLSGEKTDVTDQFELTMLRFFGGQDLQPAQKELIDGIAKELVPKVKKI